MKKQIVLIHGGETFDTYEEYLEYLRAYVIDLGRPVGWKDTLAEALGDAYDVIRPSMPSPKNAKYLEWSLWFTKYIPFLKDGVILVGHSLGGIFLAKYLSENQIPVSIRATILIAAPHDSFDTPYSLADFVLPSSLALLETQGGRIVLMHSTDDPVVRFKDFESYATRLPNAEKMVCSNRGHFLEETFPELIVTIDEISG